MSVRLTHSPDGDVLIHVHGLADPNVELNLNPDRWNLQENQASIVLGRDVITPGTFRTDGGRQPLGVALGANDVTSAHGLDFFGRSAMRFQDVGANPRYEGGLSSLQRITPFSPLLGATDYAWAPEMVDGTFILMPDVRDGHASWADKAPIHARITSITQTTNPNDTINWTPSLPSAGAWDNGEFTKFEILYSKAFDKRGIWVTDGRKFWLLHGQSYTKYLDIGTDDALGEEWDMCRVHSQVLMFVNSKYPPRIVHLGDPALGENEDSTDRSLAGMLPPRKPRSIEREPTIDREGLYPSFFMSNIGGEGSLSAGTCRIMLRAVNKEDDAQSEFVAIPRFNNDSYVEVVANDGVRLGAEMDNLDTLIGTPCPFHERWTHIEVWRTLSADGISFHRETSINIANFLNEEDVTAAPEIVNALIATQFYECTLSDVDLAAMPVLTLADVIAGGLPPICQRVVSLHGITVCMGKAQDDVETATAYSWSFYQETYTITVGGAVSTGSNQFVNYNTSFGEWTDTFVITDGGGGEATLGEYTIASRDNDDQITISGYTGSATSGDLHGYIKRAYDIEHPEIKSDEDVWYSRADVFAPESFPTRVLKLSSSGDEFKSIVVVSNYAAVIMRSGVHLLYHNYASARLEKDTVAMSGQGTPWAKSVVVLANSVLWAAPDGPRQMVVSNEANQDGFRGSIRPLGGGAVRQWFRDAYDAGYDIDAGVDETNHCVRWRATDPDDANYFQVCQFSYATNRWTLLDDDTGVAYAATTYAESTALGATRLYSVDVSGNVFIVNHQGTAHEYDDDTVQDTIDTDDGWTVSTTTIEHTDDIFNLKMLGDAVRFRSDTASVNGQCRRIIDVTEKKITFDEVAGLANGDEFLIAATRFRYRPAPLAGKLPLTVKTLTGIMLQARPGPRHGVDKWTDPPASAITVKTYENYADTEVSQESEVSETVSVFDEDDVSYTTVDRACAVAAQGVALEVELECVETRMDFGIEAFEARVREEGTEVSDRSAVS